MHDPNKEMWSVRHPYPGTFICLLTDDETGEGYLQVEQNHHRVNVPLYRVRELCDALITAGADLAGAIVGDA